MVLKIYLILALFSVPGMLAITIITNSLSKTPKQGKFRKWWSNNIVDLDNKYD